MKYSLIHSSACTCTSVFLLIRNMVKGEGEKLTEQKIRGVGIQVIRVHVHVRVLHIG